MQQKNVRRYPMIKNISKRIPILIGLLLGLFTYIAAPPAYAEVVFSEDFEGGWGDWVPSLGIWEIGSSTVVDCSLSGGTQCAGTILNGNYDPFTDSRLYHFSGIQLPAVSGGEELQLRFWQTFSYSSYDSGQVQVSVWDGVSIWLPWENVGNVIVEWDGAAW